MRLLVLVTVLALGACGRIGFDEAGDAGTGSGDAVVDGPVGAPFSIALTGPSDLFDVEVMPGGGAVIVGAALGPIMFGTEALTGVGGADVLIAVVAADGSVVWAKLIGGPGDDLALAVDADGDGTIYVTGLFHDTANLGGAPLTGVGNEVFVAAYSPQGAHRWSRSFGGGDTATSYTTDFGTAIEVAPNGDVVIGGSVADDVDFGVGLTTGAPSESDAFVARLSPAGVTRWAKRWGVTGTNAIYDVTIDSAGAVYAAGAYMGSLDFGEGPAPARGDLDAFVLGLSSTGVFAWSETFGGGNFDRLYGIQLSGGTLITSGYYWDTIDLPGISRSMGFADGLVVGYSTSGNRLWSTRYGGTGCDFLRGVGAVDGQAAAVGTFGTALDLGDGPHAITGGTDNLVFTSAPADGDVTWSAAFGDTTDEIAHGVAGSRTMGLYVVGSTNRAWDAGCNSSISTGYVRRM